MTLAISDVPQTETVRHNGPLKNDKKQRVIQFFCRLFCSFVLLPSIIQTGALRQCNRMMAVSKHLKAIDLFCGCGGLSLGLRRAKFKVIAAVDNHALSVETYRKNHKRTYIVKDDIKLVDTANLMDKLNLKPGELDLLAGCPPCQGFSTLRTLNGSRDIEEPMNDLVFEFVRFVRSLLPKAIMMENVPALLDDVRLRRFKDELSQLGYSCDAEVFNAVDFGVPQRRHRMILIGARGGCPSFAEPVNRRRTVAGAIRKFPDPQTIDDPAHNYQPRRSAHINTLISRIPIDGGSRTALPEKDQLECHQGFNGFKDVYGRMSWRQPAPTITGGCINPSRGRFLHPQANRAITLREAAALQGFPRSYQFDLSRGRYPAAQLIGNAFPPKFAEHHARSIYQYIENSRGAT